MIPVPPVRPPLSLATDETTTLNEFLDFYRLELLGRASGLTTEQLNVRVGASSLTLGGLVKHMAIVEDCWFEHRFAGRPKPAPSVTLPSGAPDWGLDSAAHDEPGQLNGWYRASWERSRHVVAEAPSLNDLSALTSGAGERWSLRWIMVHMIEEYARHCGHADLLRESIDGIVG